MTVAVAPLIGKRIPIIVDDVTTVVTPGENIDVVVTERGIAINPKRSDLIEALKDTKLPLMSIKDLKLLAESFTGKPDKIDFEDEVVGVIEYRDGTVMDVIRKVKR